MSQAHKEQSWEVWLNNGIDYEQSVGGRKGRPSPFAPSIQYNLIALALESYVMAMVSYHGQLPENHTFTDLIRSWEQVAPLDTKLKETILKYEDMQSICSMDNYQRFEPTLKQIKELDTAVIALGKIVKETCQKELSTMGGAS